MTGSDRETGPPREEDGGGFLGRWSRRKLEAEKQQAPGPEDGLPEEESTESTDPEAEQPVLTDEDMPDPESIDEGSDVSMFFSSGVSEELRRQALRKLFSLPRYGVRDGLDDYDGDYRSFTPLGDTVTADMKFDRERLERLAREQLDGPEETAPEETAPEEPGEAVSSTGEAGEDDATPPGEAPSEEERVAADGGSPQDQENTPT